MAKSLLGKYAKGAAKSEGTIEAVSSVEVAESFHDLESAFIACDELDAGFEELDSFITSLEAGGIFAEEPMQAREFALVNTQVEALIGEIEGVDTESFAGGESAAIAAQEVALEAWIDGLKKFWTAIKNAFLRSVEAVKDFVTKMIGGLDKVVKRAEAASKEAGEKGVKEEAVKVAGVGKMVINNKIDASVVEAGIKAIEGIEPFVTGCFTHLKEAASLNIEEVVMKSFDTDEEVKEADTDLAKTAEKMGASYDKLAKIAKGSTGKLPGNVSFAYDSSLPEDDSVLAKLMHVQGLPKLEINREKFTGKEADAIAPLTVETIAAIAEFAATYAADKDALKKFIEEEAKATKQSLKAIDDMVNEGEKGTLKKAWTKQRVRAFSRGYAKVRTRTINKIDNYAWGVLRAYVGYAEASVK